LVLNLYIYIFYNKMLLSEKLFFFKSEREAFFCGVSRILNLKSFCSFVKLQQEPFSGKYTVNAVFFLIQPASNKWVFVKLKKILGFGDICVDAKDKSFVLFRIKGLNNVEVLLNSVKPYLNLSLSFFDLYFQIIELKKNIKYMNNFLILHIKIDSLKQQNRELCISSPKDLIPSYINSRLKPISL
jgi:hypothetical protein